MLINPKRCPCPDCGNMLEITTATEEALETVCTVCLQEFTIETKDSPEAQKLASNFILDNILAEC